MVGIIGLLLVSKLPPLEVHGRFNYTYTKEETGDTLLPYREQYWLHYGIVEFVSHPREGLDIVFAKDFGGTSGHLNFFVKYFVQKLKGNATVGKFSIPFGKKIKDHTSLLEDEIGLGFRNRERLGIGGETNLLPVTLKMGYFPTTTYGSRWYVGTISKNIELIEIGGGFLLDEFFELDQNYQKKAVVKKKYFEIYSSIFIPFIPHLPVSLFFKTINGELNRHYMGGYSFNIGFPVKMWFYPFIEIEELDKNKEKEDDKKRRKVIGVKSMFVHNTVLRAAYYIYEEEKKQIDNNLFSLMLIVWW